MSQLTRSFQDRVFIGLLGAVFAPVCGYMLFFVHVRPWTEETDWAYRILSLLRVEGLSIVFSIASLAVVWAIWTPNWIERRLRKSFGRFVIFLFVVSLLLAIMCFYMVFAGPGT